MNNRVLVGGIIASVALFILGFLVYGIALRETMEANTMAGLSRTDAEMNWVIMALAHVAFGFGLAYILDKANTVSFGSGATVALIVGTLFVIGFDFLLYAATNYFTSMTGLLLDVVGSAVMMAVTGGIVGWWYSRGRSMAMA